MSRNLIQFLTARICTIFAFQMQVVAIGWQMYSLTNSAMDLGLIGLAQYVPAMLLTLLAGHAADHYDRRLIAIGSQLVMAVMMLMLAWGSWHHTLTRETMFVLVVIIGSAKAFESPAMSSLLPALVPIETLPRAISLSSSVMQAGFIIGPALGGLIYIAGSQVVYSTSLVLFAAAIASLLLIRKTNQQPAKTKVDLHTMLAGLRYIRSNKVILGAISMDLFAVLFGGATALLPIYAKDYLQTGSWGLGLLRASPAIGALLMSLWLTWNPIQKQTGRLMFIAVAIYGAATIAFGFSNSLFWSVLTLLILGASDMISVVIRSALVQLETPDEMRGRVSAVNFLFIGTSNQFGEFESGLTAHWWGARASVVVGGVGTLIVVGLWAYLFPELASRDKLVEDKAY